MAPDAARLLSQPSPKRKRRGERGGMQDSISQSLTGTYLQAVMVTQKMKKDGAAQAEGVARLTDMLRQAVAELRGTTRRLTTEEEALPPQAGSR